MVIKIEINDGVPIEDILYILRRLGRDIEIIGFANKSIRVFNIAGDPVGNTTFEVSSPAPTGE